MLIIESEGHRNVSDYPAIQNEMCCGCDEHFVLSDSFESLVDRVRKRSYLIHATSNCWQLLETKLKGEAYGNLPAWAKL